MLKCELLSPFDFLVSHYLISWNDERGPCNPEPASQSRRWVVHLKAFMETIFIAIIMVPNTMYYGSVNALSQLLLKTYGDSNIITNSSLMHSVPSIFSAFSVSFFTDVLGVEFMLLPLQTLILIGCICSALAKSSGVFLIGRFCYGLCGEGLIMVQSKLISNRIPASGTPLPLHSYSVDLCLESPSLVYSLEKWTPFHLHIS